MGRSQGRLGLVTDHDVAVRIVELVNDGPVTTILDF